MFDNWQFHMFQPNKYIYIYTHMHIFIFESGGWGEEGKQTEGQRQKSGECSLFNSHWKGGVYEGTFSGGMKRTRRTVVPKKQREYRLSRRSEGIMLLHIPKGSRKMWTKNKFLLELIIQRSWLPLWAGSVECGGKNQIVEVEELMRNEDKTMSIDCVSKSLAKKKR